MFRRSIASKEQVEEWMVELRGATLLCMAKSHPRDMARMAAVFNVRLGFTNLYKAFQRNTSKPEGK